MLFVIDLGYPAWQATFPDVIAMTFQLLIDRELAAGFVEPDFRDATGAIERGPGEIELHGLPRSQRCSAKPSKEMAIMTIDTVTAKVGGPPISEVYWL